MTFNVANFGDFHIYSLICGNSLVSKITIKIIFKGNKMSMVQRQNLINRNKETLSQ